MAISGNTTENTRREVRDAFYSAKWLDYNLKVLLWQKFAMQIEMPKGEGKTVHVKAWNPPARVVTPVPLLEGVTPDSKKLTRREVSAQLVWYGNFLEHTDLLETIFEDADNLKTGENQFLSTLQSEERDMSMFNILTGGTNVVYANNVASRVAVRTAISIGDLHMASRTLKNGLDGRAGLPITQIMRSDGSFGTVDVEASYIAIITPDLEYDIRSLPGFSPTSSYASGSSVIDPHEFGKVDNFRFICTTNYEPFRNAGAANPDTENLLSSDTANADVYPILIFSQDAFATIPLTGDQGMKLIRKELGSSGGLDPLNQRATVGYKNPFAGVITYQERMVRLEVGCTEQAGL